MSSWDARKRSIWCGAPGPDKRFDTADDLATYVKSADAESRGPADPAAAARSRSRSSTIAAPFNGMRGDHRDRRWTQRAARSPARCVTAREMATGATAHARSNAERAIQPVGSARRRTTRSRCRPPDSECVSREAHACGARPRGALGEAECRRGRPRRWWCRCAGNAPAADRGRRACRRRVRRRAAAFPAA